MGSCPAGCQGCGVFQCITQGLQCPVKCERLGQGGCGKAAPVNGLGCAWVSGACVAWDIVRGGVVGPGMVRAVEYVEPVLSPEESSRLFPASSPSLLPTSTSTTSTIMSEPQTPTSPSSSPSPSPSASSPESSPESSPSPTPDTDAQKPDPAKSSRGMSSFGKMALAIVIMAIIGLISWGGLYYFTRDKANFRPPSLLSNRNVLPTYSGSSFVAGGDSSHMSTLRDSYRR
ncbi:hypothetical protein IWW37_005868 [Coemansia sp. RSA 2050]|nr:hypothetical protein IWW37_005868 [Coemansia sp. RSA 2050]KAJ2728809.1 hypothetical protein IW152_005852 [Coemansia sp. BCRC 34962]